MDTSKDPKIPQRHQSLSILTFKRGHRPTDSGVSCLTTVSMASEEDISDLDEEVEEEMGDFDQEGKGVIFKSSYPGCVKLDMPNPICMKEQKQQEMIDPDRIPGEPLKTFLSGCVKLDMPIYSKDKEQQKEIYPEMIPGEPLKTFLSGLFLGAGFLATTISLAFTHERVPETEPLPDLLLDHVKYQEWRLDVSEVLLMLNTSVAVIVVMLHSYIYFYYCCSHSGSH